MLLDESAGLGASCVRAATGAARSEALGAQDQAQQLHSDGVADMRELTQAKLTIATDIAARHDGGTGFQGAQALEAA
eukprot:2838969-Lingulodinium_polyedra.AAC.1